MSHSVELLIERFSPLGEPATFDMPAFPEYELSEAEVPGAIELTQSPYALTHEYVSAHAFMALVQRRDEKLLALLLAKSDEKLLSKLGEFISSHALPFYDAPLISELNALIADNSLTAQRRLAAAELLQEFASLHPEYYGRVVKVLGTRLQDYANNSPAVNAELVAACIALQTDELFPVIESAFMAGKVSHPEYATAEDVYAAMTAPETAFEAGLEHFMHTKELDEIRSQLEQDFASHTANASIDTDFPISNIGELDGLLHALAVSPIPISRSHWVDLVYAGLLEGKDEQSQEVCIEKLSTYYSEVKDALVMEECAPHFEVSCESMTSQLYNVLPWARGFLIGYDLWRSEDKLHANKAEATAELLEFLQAIADDKPLPEQYQSLANSDYSMILQLMLQRVYAELQPSPGKVSLDENLEADHLDDDPMQGFFNNFTDD